MTSYPKDYTTFAMLPGVHQQGMQLRIAFRT